MLRDSTITPIVDRPLFSGDAEVGFFPDPSLPVGFVAGFEVRPGRYVFVYRSDIYTRAQAAEVARLVVGPFHDRTEEAIAEVTPC